jgi:hypothetical protein
MRKVFLSRGVGMGEGMNSDMIIALSGLMSLAAAASAGALWGSPLVVAAFRWLAR